MTTASQLGWERLGLLLLALFLVGYALFAIKRGRIRFPSAARHAHRDEETGDFWMLVALHALVLPGLLIAAAIWLLPYLHGLNPSSRPVPPMPSGHLSLVTSLPIDAGVAPPC